MTVAGRQPHRDDRRRARLSAAVAMVVLLAGCGGDTTEPVDASTEPAAPGETEVAQPAGLDDGRHPAYIAAIDVAGRTVTVDVIQFLTGAEAQAAYAEDHPDETDGPPNDYYIRNENAQLRVLPVDPEVDVSVVWLGSGGTDVEEITFEELPGYFVTDPDPDDTYAWWAPFWFTVSGGVVTTIEEQYLP